MAIIYKKITTVDESAELNESVKVFINDAGKLRQIKQALLLNEIDVPIDNDSIIIENDMLQVGAVDVIKLTQTPDVELIFDAGTSV